MHAIYLLQGNFFKNKINIKQSNIIKFSSGLDITTILEYLNLGNLASKATTSAGTFVVAYAIHKVFLPVRVGITLTATPFIVRYLRRIGILKVTQTKK